MITFKSRGNWSVTTEFLTRCKNSSYKKIVKQCGNDGVDALANATPVRSGRTANSWGVDVSEGSSGMTVSWSNSNINDNVNIAIIIDKGHGTRNGGYVPPVNYIDPTINPIIEKANDKIWKEVIDG